MSPDDTATLLRLVELAMRRAAHKYDSDRPLRDAADELAKIAQAMEPDEEVSS